MHKAVCGQLQVDSIRRIIDAGRLFRVDSGSIVLTWMTGIGATSPSGQIEVAEKHSATINLANNDPAACYPAAVLGLGAIITATWNSGGGRSARPKRCGAVDRRL